MNKKDKLRKMVLQSKEKYGKVNLHEEQELSSSARDQQGPNSLQDPEVLGIVLSWPAS